MLADDQVNTERDRTGCQDAPAEGGWWPPTLGEGVAVCSPRGSSGNIRLVPGPRAKHVPAERASVVAASRELRLPLPGCGPEWALVAHVEALSPRVTYSGPPELRGCT